VFVAVGERGLERLIEAFDDPSTSPGLRRHLPRTISRFRSAPAAAALVVRLERERDTGSELKLLRALGRMRSDDPELVIAAGPVRDQVRRAVADAARYATFQDQLAETADLASPVIALIHELLSDKRRGAVERAFRGLGILHPRAGLRTVHDALTGPDEARAGAAREIIEATVGLELRSPLLAVVDDLSPVQRRTALGKLAPAPFANHEALIVALLADPSESLRCLVAYHIADRHLVALRAELARLRPSDGLPLVTFAFDEAIARLDG